MLSFAIGTLITGTVWLIMCFFDFKKDKLAVKEIMYVLFLQATTIGTGVFMVSYRGLIVYLTLFSILTMVSMKEKAVYLFSQASAFFKRLIRRN